MPLVGSAAGLTMSGFNGIDPPSLYPEDTIMILWRKHNPPGAKTDPYEENMILSHHETYLYIASEYNIYKS